MNRRTFLKAVGLGAVGYVGALAAVALPSKCETEQQAVRANLATITFAPGTWHLSEPITFSGGGSCVIRGCTFVDNADTFRVRLS